MVSWTSASFIALDISLHIVFFENINWCGCPHPFSIIIVPSRGHSNFKIRYLTTKVSDWTMMANKVGILSDTDKLSESWELIPERKSIGGRVDPLQKLRCKDKVGCRIECCNFYITIGIGIINEYKIWDRDADSGIPWKYLRWLIKWGTRSNWFKILHESWDTKF